MPALAGLLAPATGSTPLAAPCGAGPAVEIDGVAYPTSVSGTLARRPGRAAAAGDRLRRLRERVPCRSRRASIGCVRCRRPAFVAESAALVRDGAAATPPAVHPRAVAGRPVGRPPIGGSPSAPARRRCSWCRRTSTRAGPPRWPAAAARGAGGRVAAGVRGAGRRGRRGDAAVHAGPPVPGRARRRGGVRAPGRWPRLARRCRRGGAGCTGRPALAAQPSGGLRSVRRRRLVDRGAADGAGGGARRRGAVPRCCWPR